MSAGPQFIDGRERRGRREGSDNVSKRGFKFDIGQLGVSMVLANVAGNGSKSICSCDRHWSARRGPCGAVTGPSSVKQVNVLGGGFDLELVAIAATPCQRLAACADPITIKCTLAEGFTMPKRRWFSRRS